MPHQSSLKLKPAVALKNTHSEQYSKLQSRHQHDSDLLEDIRNFSKQRSQIEKEYAQALLKLSGSFLSKKDFYMIPDLPPENARDFKTITAVWKTILEVTENIAKERQNAAETYMHQVSESIKVLRQNKVHAGKKVLEQVAVIQAEINQSSREMIKAQKLYAEDEHIAHDARGKSAEAEAKLKKKSTGLFSSLATLQKNSAKLTNKKEISETKSDSARNEYLLCMAAINAQHLRYYQTDLTELMQQMDGEMYEKIQDAFITLSKTELECCGVTQESFSKALCDAAQINRQYNLQCFLQQNTVFMETLHFEFEPIDGDKVSRLVNDPKSEHNLDNEAKKWAAKVVRESKAIRDNSNSVRTLFSQAPVERSSTSETGEEKTQENTEQKIDELKDAIRKSETAKMKAEARLELIRQAGIDVDEWLNRANMDTLSPIDVEDDLSRTSISESVRTSSSGGQSEDVNGRTFEQNNVDYTYDDDDFNDDTFEVINPPLEAVEAVAATDEYVAVALYDFPASNPDELSMSLNENVTVLGAGFGDGWLRARNSRGEEGFIPENYIQYYSTDVSAMDEVPYGTTATDPSASYQVQYQEPAAETWQNENMAQQSYAAWENPSTSDTQAASWNNDNMSDNQTSSWNNQDQTTNWVQQDNPQTWQEEQPEEIIDNGVLSPQKVESYTSADYEVQQAMVASKEISSNSEGFWCRALYDYEACESGELSFQESQLIHIIRHDVNGVDDGWWEGEINGKVGVFPSIMVEEIQSRDNTTVPPQLSVGTLEFAPPSTVDGQIKSPPPVTVTMPTPSEEQPPPVIEIESSTGDVESSTDPSSENVDMTRPSSACLEETGNELATAESQPMAKSAPGSPVNSGNDAINGDGSSSNLPKTGSIIAPDETAPSGGVLGEEGESLC